MVKNHLKRIAAPNTWKINRKESKFITRANPGPHNFYRSIPLSVFIRELVKVAKTAKEAKQIVKTKDVFVDRKIRKDIHHPVGLMDVVSFPQLEENFRVLLDKKGQLTAVKTALKEAGTKLSRIESKSKISGGKTQLNLIDGRNIIVEKDTYKTGDTVQLSLPDQKITNHIKFEKDALVLLIGGSCSGSLARIEEIHQNKIILKSSKNTKFETLKKYAFVVGTDKPVLDSIKENESGKTNKN
jgi:small subunit ribosomal protein S4e